ncbi:MAG TPA: (2Fe-2S)-binding protein [Ignavibacteriaceae bacterium]|nr:(2Fe-2S)-binding protein [Ignavibacteriaceae bacterium]
MSTFILNVNGENRTVQVEENTPLLWVLRDNLQLTGTKYSCGIGLCGTCVVHIDGIAVRSCSVSVKDSALKSILTIEGLAQNPDHPIFKSWIDHEVSQCGYCQPGQIMTIAALLNQNPNPSDKEIEDTMSGVLCRCGTYPRIKKAIDKLISGEVK